MKKYISKYTPGDYELKVKRTKTGLGLFSMSEIPKGKCIIEYKGRVISKKEEYTINSKYLMEIDSRTVIDGSARSNIARYINHSCKPNAEIATWKKKAWIMSIKKIKPGEEILYDYGEEYWEEYIGPHRCRCSRCRHKSAHVI